MSSQAGGVKAMVSLSVRVLIITILSSFFFPSMAELQVLKNENRHQSTEPIEITADSLEVKQSENLAIFRGDVDAVQGDMLLRADLLFVHYRKDIDKSEEPCIKRIDAEGNVFISSPNETAQGAKAIYNVDDQKIWVSGRVILTQGDNIIEGDQLELDLKSGESKVLSGNPGEGSGKRVRGVFVPKKQD